MYVLVVAIYTALGGQFDKPPHDFATFSTLEACETARRIVVANSHLGVDYVALAEASDSSSTTVSLSAGSLWL